MNSTFFKFPLLLTLLSTLFLSSCEDDTRFQIDYSTVPDAYSISGAKKVVTETGLIYYVIEEGSGTLEVTPRDQIQIFYTKRLKRDLDHILSSSYANGVQQPVSASLGASRIVSEAGFREGLLGMKEGEKRVLILPPDLAYGGSPNSSFAEDTLWIDVELDQIIYL
jgi:FKBP-type peptidyl-prolyl cis-trans isomerase